MRVGVTHRLLGSHQVVPFCGLYSEFYKVIPKKELPWSLRVGRLGRRGGGLVVEFKEKLEHHCPHTLNQAMKVKEESPQESP